MDRGSFLKRMGAFAIGAWLGRNIELPSAGPTTSSATFLYLDQGTLELGVAKDSLVSRGGFCAPFSYQYPIFSEVFENVAEVRPVREALPAFTATRGGVKIVPH